MSFWESVNEYGRSECAVVAILCIAVQAVVPIKIKTRQIRDRNRCFLSEGVVIYIERQKATIIIKKY